MRPLHFLFSVLMLLTGCGSEQRQLGSDSIEIISAILVKQYDGAKEHKALLAENPEMKVFYEDLLDFRLCVSKEVAGKTGDFDRMYSETPGSPPFDGRDLTKRWEDSDHRFSIKNQLALPGHLRWNSPIALCPEGVLYLGTPEISDESARVFVRRECSGWCGWGGEITLRRQKGKWKIDREVTWWVS